MHKIIKSYLDRFTRDNALGALGEAERFELFVNFVVISKFFPDQFDIEDVTTSDQDGSIDGAAILIGDELIGSAEEADKLFQSLRPRQQVSVVYLFVQAKRSEGFDAGDLLKFGSGVKLLFHEDGQPPRDVVLSNIISIHDKVVENLSRIDKGRPRCHLYFATTGVWKEESGLGDQVKVIDQLVRSTGLFDDVVFEPIDREKLIRLWLQSQALVEATFPVKASIPLPQISGVEEAYLVIASAPSFVDNVLTDDDGRIRAAIFEQNVRAYLGDENPVNSKIIEGVQNAKEHDRFPILNNGITIVSPDVKIQGNRISISDYQIVNGCQTSHVLFRNRGHISDSVYLPIKVIEADAPEMVAQIVEAANSQSQVEATQFFSTRPFVRKIEMYFDAFDNETERERRMYFERRTRQFVGHDISKIRIFDIRKLARAFAAMFLDVPHLASRYPTQTLEEMSDRLFKPDHREHAYYTAALSLYRWESSRGSQYGDRQYQIYRWHLLMIVKYQLAGTETPPLNSKKLDKYCENIVKAFSAGGKSSAPPFQEATKVIAALGNPSRDKLKTQAFTDSVKNYLGVKKKGNNH